MRLPRELLRILYPNRCPVCDRPLPREAEICPGCEKARLTYTGGARCEVCGLRLKDCACGERLFYEKAVFPFHYDGDVRATLRKLKFSGRLDLVSPVAREICRAAEERGVLRDADLLCFVPMRRFAQFRRGYNQAAELAAEVGRRTGIPVVPLLWKCQRTAPQHTLRLSRRRGNVLGAFEPVPETEAMIEGRTVLLVDDILTSGNTANEAAKTLLIFGAAQVIILCAAAAKKKKT